MPDETSPLVTATTLWQSYSITTSVVVAVDVDDDGDLDIFLGNQDAANQFFYNHGSGNFVQDLATPFDVGHGMTSSAHFVDLDNDGDIDVYVSSNSARRVFMNLGIGDDSTGTSFVTDTNSILTTLPVIFTERMAFADVNGDGRIDLLHPDGSRLLMNTGSASAAFVDDSTNALVQNNGFTKSVAFGDLDGDGDLDALVGNQWSRNELYINDGNGDFTLDATSAVSDGFLHSRVMQWVDVDNDGDLDVFASGEPNRIYLNSGGSLTWDMRNSDLTAANPGARYMGFNKDAAFGDTDGDGDVDIFLVNEEVQQFVNDGTGIFTITSTVSGQPNVGGSQPNFASSTANAVKLVDLNGDRWPDLLVSFSTWGVVVYLNDGAGGFDACLSSCSGINNQISLPSTEPAPAAYGCTGCTVSVAYGSHSFFVADFDGDGDADLLLGSDAAVRGDAAAGYQSVRSAVVYANNGQASFTIVTGQSVSLAATAVGDLDGDMDVDLLFGYGSESSVLLNDGTGRFTLDSTATFDALRVQIAGQGQLVITSLADIDQDGDLDVRYHAHGFHSARTLPLHAACALTASRERCVCAAGVPRQSKLSEQALPLCALPKRRTLERLWCGMLFQVPHVRGAALNACHGARSVRRVRCAYATKRTGQLQRVRSRSAAGYWR